MTWLERDIYEHIPRTGDLCDFCSYEMPHLPVAFSSTSYLAGDAISCRVALHRGICESDSTSKKDEGFPYYSTVPTIQRLNIPTLTHNATSHEARKQPERCPGGFIGADFHIHPHKPRSTHPVVPVSCLDISSLARFI